MRWRASHDPKPGNLLSNLEIYYDHYVERKHCPDRTFAIGGNALQMRPINMQEIAGSQGPEPLISKNPARHMPATAGPGQAAQTGQPHVHPPLQRRQARPRPAPRHARRHRLTPPDPPAPRPGQRSPARPDNPAPAAPRLAPGPAAARAPTPDSTTGQHARSTTPDHTTRIPLRRPSHQAPGRRGQTSRRGML